MTVIMSNEGSESAMLVDDLKYYRWVNLSPEKKKQKLYENQKQWLNALLKHGAISQEQYDKCFDDLIRQNGDCEGMKDRISTVLRNAFNTDF